MAKIAHHFIWLTGYRELYKMTSIQFYNHFAFMILFYCQSIQFIFVIGLFDFFFFYLFICPFSQFGIGFISVEYWSILLFECLTMLDVWCSQSRSSKLISDECFLLDDAFFSLSPGFVVSLPFLFYFIPDSTKNRKFREIEWCSANLSTNWHLNSISSTIMCSMFNVHWWILHFTFHQSIYRCWMLIGNKGINDPSHSDPMVSLNCAIMEMRAYRFGFYFRFCANANANYMVVVSLCGVRRMQALYVVWKTACNY